MQFPILSQARRPFARIGEGMEAANIDEPAQILIGKCSCQIKEQNPGLDLLFSQGSPWFRTEAAIAPAGLSA